MEQADIDLIFEEWEASLRNRDKSTSSMQENFLEIFDTLKTAGATFAEVKAYLPKIIQAHYPPTPVIRSTFNKLKKTPYFDYSNEKEFADKWKKDIDRVATNTFFDLFPRPKTLKEKEAASHEMTYRGKIPIEEYKKLRTYADSFPVLDTAELELKMTQGTYNPEVDLVGLLTKQNIQKEDKEDDGNPK